VPRWSNHQVTSLSTHRELREADDVSSTMARERASESSSEVLSEPRAANVAVSRKTRLARARYHGGANRSMDSFSRLAAYASVRL
jgi:hypothetical protein